MIKIDFLGRKISLKQGILSDEEELKLICFDYVSNMIGMDSSITCSPSTTNEMKDEKQWTDDIIIQTFEPNEVLIKEGEKVDGIYYVISGELQASFIDKNTQMCRYLFVCNAGGFVGYVANLTGTIYTCIY